MAFALPLYKDEFTPSQYHLDGIALSGSLPAYERTAACSEHTDLGKLSACWRFSRPTANARLDEELLGTRPRGIYVIQ